MTIGGLHGLTYKIANIENSAAIPSFHLMGKTCQVREKRKKYFLGEREKIFFTPWSKMMNPVIVSILNFMNLIFYFPDVW